MNSSDIIAIVAIVISATVSVVTTISAYKINKENNKAKLVEIAFEKRLEAYREILERIGKSSYALAGLSTSKDNKKLFDDYYPEFVKAMEGIIEIFDKNGVYIAGELEKEINDYRRTASYYLKKLKNSDYDDVGWNEFLNDIGKKEIEIRHSIQKILDIH